MTDKILCDHTVYIENRKVMKLSGIIGVTAYDEYKLVVKTDYGKLIIAGKNLVAGTMNTESRTMELTGDINYLQYQANGGKSESGFAKLFR